METQTQLKKLGLTEKKKPSYYINALELGSFSVMGIAHKSGIKRPTCYLILDELVKKGLVSIIPRAKKLLYIAGPPEVLIKQAEEQVSLTKSFSAKTKFFLQYRQRKSCKILFRSKKHP